MPTYGPTLIFEIQAAGLGALNIAVTSDTIIGWDKLTADQQSDLQVVLDAHDPTDRRPRYLPRKEFLLALEADGKYDDFMTWKASQPAATKIYFDEEAGFSEDDTKIAAAMTALSTTPGTFFAGVLP